MKKIYALLLLIIAFFSFGLNVKGISDISINNNKLVPNFDINTKIYNVFVSSKTEIITINVTPEEGEVISGGGSVSLKKGLNEVEIISYIDEEVSSKYVLNIVRGDVKTDKSVATLSSIKIDNHQLEFRSDVYSYNIDALDDEDRLNISYETTSPTSSVKVNGDIILNKERNIINLVVTSEDKKSTNTYTIKVSKNIDEINGSDKKSSIFDGRDFTKYELKLIIGGLVAIGVFILSTLFYFMFFKKSKRFKVRFKKFGLKRKRT